MASVVNTDKKIAIVGALAEGDSAAILQEYRNAQTA
jgi:hypothetical protein